MHYWKYPAYSFGTPSYVGRRHLWILPPTSPPPSNQSIYDFVDQRTSTGRSCSGDSIQKQVSNLSVCHVTAWQGAAGLPPKLWRQSSSSGGGASVSVRQLRRGSFGVSPAAPAGVLCSSPAAQLREYNPFRLHVAVESGIQRVRTKVPFPQLISTMAEKNPTTSLYLLWKYLRRQT